MPYGLSFVNLQDPRQAQESCTSGQALMGFDPRHGVLDSDEPHGAPGGGGGVALGDVQGPHEPVVMQAADGYQRIQDRFGEVVGVGLAPRARAAPWVLARPGRSGLWAGAVETAARGPRVCGMVGGSRKLVLRGQRHLALPALGGPGVIDPRPAVAADAGRGLALGLARHEELDPLHSREHALPPRERHEVRSVELMNLPALLGADPEAAVS